MGAYSDARRLRQNRALLGEPVCTQAADDADSLVREIGMVTKASRACTFDDGLLTKGDVHAGEGVAMPRWRKYRPGGMGLMMNPTSSAAAAWTRSIN